MFTVSFLHSDGSQQVSRYFETRRAALKWAKWIIGHAWAVEAYVYRCPAGGELIETIR
jgi:hypothetical protein